MRKIIIAILALLGVLGVGYRVWLLYSTAPCPSTQEIALRIQQDPAAQQCADISVAMDRCVVRLAGRIESQEQLARLRGMVQNMPGITYVNETSVRIVEAPFCEVMDILEPVQKHAAARNFDLKVQLMNKGEKKTPVYTQGELLVIEVTTPGKFGGFVYVDYYAADGQVYHLFPNLREALNFLPPHSVYTVGQPDGQHETWKVQPPYGREMLTVIVTKAPLVFMPRAPRYTPEISRGYLDQLRQAIPRDLSQAEIAATVHTIETRKTGAETP